MLQKITKRINSQQKFFKHIWLRDEVKRGERRSALTPKACQELLEDGFKITVEKSSNRIFEDEEFKKIGCEMTNSQSWVSAPEETFILGLKELPTEKMEGIPYNLKHRHILFGHCYKHQPNWKTILNRFKQGQGELLDLEFLKWDNNNRVAAFGKSAGYAGMSIGVLVWIHQQLNGFEIPFPKPIEAYENKHILIEEMKSGLKKIGKKPEALILGSRGRCGEGASEVCSNLGIDPIKWNSKDTSRNGPFNELTKIDILLNAIYLSDENPKQLFLDNETLEKSIKEGYRKLSVFVDVSCDTGNPKNPFPISQNPTTFYEPIDRILTSNDPLDIIAIDHLPTLIPRESSKEYCNALLPHLKHLTKVDFDQKEIIKTSNDDEMKRVWERVRNLYYSKIKDL